MSMNFGIAEYWYDLYDFLLENTLQIHNAALEKYRITQINVPLNNI